MSVIGARIVYFTPFAVSVPLKMKIVTVLGARPQFIKAATVSRALAHAGIAETIIHTGQHFDANMSDIFFQEMDIPKPHYHLEISGLSHGAMTGRMLEKVEDLLRSEKPDTVLVYGDTNSTLAGALAAAKLRIPLAHVEAGLRSFNLNMPEEINRILTDRMSSILFCPTATAVKNLEREGFREFGSSIHLTGDVMYDALKYYQTKAIASSTILKQHDLKAGAFVLATIHRAENTDDPRHLASIVAALNTINQETAVVVPLHPRTKQHLKNAGIKTSFTLLDPVGYFDMLSLLKHCTMVLTDSGGLQKEAYLSGKFCLTLRNETEWVELVKAGANVLVGTNEKKITGTFRKNKKKVVRVKPIYGNGHAAEKIVKRLARG